MNNLVDPNEIANRIVRQDPESIRENLKMPPEEQSDRDRLKDPRSRATYDFDFRHEDTTGKVWEGQFTTKIMSPSERFQAAALHSQLLYQDSRVVQIDPVANELALISARLTVCLVEKPEWAKRLGEFEDWDVLYQLYEKVLDHEQFFRRLGSYAPRGPKKSGQRRSESPEMVD